MSAPEARRPSSPSRMPCWPGSRATAGCTCRRPGRRSRPRRSRALRASRSPTSRGPAGAVHRRRDPRAELIALARDAYARFGHPAVTPLVQLDRSLWALELFHGPTLAFKDVAMQLLARLMDRVLAARGDRVTIVGATSGDTGGAADRGFPRLEPRRCDRALPTGAHLRRAAAHDDHGRRAQRARRRRRRHVRRLPGAGEGDVQ